MIPKIIDIQRDADKETTDKPPQQDTTNLLDKRFERY
jgi:hypothetical protein